MGNMQNTFYRPRKKKPTPEVGSVTGGRPKTGPGSPGWMDIMPIPRPGLPPRPTPRPVGPPVQKPGTTPGVKPGPAPKPGSKKRVKPVAPPRPAPRPIGRRKKSVGGM